MSARYVMHDGARWRVARQYPEVEANGVTEQWYDLERSNGPGRGFRILAARVSECESDRHEPRRTIKADGITLVYNVARNRLTVRKGRIKGYEVTLQGLYQALAWQAGRKLALDRAFKRRTRKRG